MLVIKDVCSSWIDEGGRGGGDFTVEHFGEDTQGYLWVFETRFGIGGYGEDLGWSEVSDVVWNEKEGEEACVDCCLVLV